MIELAYNEIIKFLDEAVAEKGADYVCERDSYEGCRYVRENKPSCLVGNVLHRAGIPLSELTKLEGLATALVIRTLSDKGLLRVSESARLALARVQAMQDSGIPWGQARDRALTW